MAKLAMNKSSLNRERKKLETYERFLPSLEMKRRQLTALRNRAREELARLRELLDRERAAVGNRLPMLASDQFDLRGLVQIERVDLRRENAVGLELPVLRNLVDRVEPYSYLAEPHWVDNAVDSLRTALRLRVQVEIAERRLDILEDGVRKITQRVNLFREVLIPQTRENIRRIGVYLGDAERAAVIRAKIAKGKRARRASA
jgi:V/A-type H+-transporting ATPase subunit D